MEAEIGDLVGESQARELGAQLAEVYEIERLQAELGTETDSERERKTQRSGSSRWSVSGNRSLRSG